MLLLVSLARSNPRAAVRLLRAPAREATWVQRAVTIPLGTTVRRPTGAAIITAWRDAEALDAFAARAPLSPETWRLEPLRAVGRWQALDGMTDAPGPPAGDGEPVAVLTLARPRPRRMPAFLKATAKAEAAAVAHPAMTLGTAMVAPPGFAATFSLWSDVPAMRQYVGGEHGAAMRENAAEPFHREQLFARFRAERYTLVP